MRSDPIPKSFESACHVGCGKEIRYTEHDPGKLGTDMVKRTFFNTTKRVISLRNLPAILTFLFFGFWYAATSFAATEPSPASAPTVTPPTITNYFDLEVNYTKPADALGVLVIVRQGATLPENPPNNGTIYTANSRIGIGDKIISSCFTFCEYVVADNNASGTVIVDGLKEGIEYHFAAYSYNGIGVDITYNQTINASSSVTTATVPIAGTSHNELWVAAASPKDGTAGGEMTSADCVLSCHATGHHSSTGRPRGLDQWDACFSCHSSVGAASAKPNIGLHLADGSVDCGSCHSIHALRTEELYSQKHDLSKGFNKSFIRKNMNKYINPDKYPPPSGPSTATALDNTVFQNRLTDFAFADGDTDANGEYNGVCQSCHTTVSYHTQNLPDNSHNIGTDCTTCHAHSSSDEYNAFKAGHANNHFGWAGGCETCHGAGAATEAVVLTIHSNNCDLCHTTGGPYDSSSEKAGDNGDGDATAADGAAADTPKFDDTVYNCIMCHAPVNAGVIPSTTGGIHHNNTGSVSYDPNKCTDCHTAVDHVSMIADAPGNCNSCHTLTEAQANVNPPVSTGDPKVHDLCTSCHVFAASPDYKGDLVTIITATKGLPTGKLPTGGGDCVNCHTNGLTKSGSAGMHHTSSLATAGTCQACHTNAKVDTGVAPEQLACRQCHVNINGENGVVVTSLRLSLASGASPTKLDNTLSDRAGITAAGVVTSHTIANGTPTQINDLRICFACHDGTYTNDSAVTAQAVTPFHGYPGDLAQGSLIDTGQGGFARRTMIGGGTMGVSEATLNTIPLIFQYYHPGHNYFRRFSTPGTAEGHSQDFAITRRGTQNSNQDNEELYRGKPLSPSGTVVSTGTTNCTDTFDQTAAYRDLFDRGQVIGSTAECAHVRYGGRGAYDQLPLLSGIPSRTANPPNIGLQWEDKGYTLFFTAPYTRFNAGNKPADTTEIPYFTALGAPDDRVFVNSAEVDSGMNLNVIASNDEGCSLLTVSGYPGTFTLNAGTGYCEYTTVVVSVPATIDVLSSGTGTPSVTGFSVTDNSI